MLGEHEYFEGVTEESLTGCSIIPWFDGDPWRIRVDALCTLKLSHWHLEGGIIEAPNNVYSGSMESMFVNSGLSVWVNDAGVSRCVILAGNNIIAQSTPGCIIVNSVLIRVGGDPPLLLGFIDDDVSDCLTNCENYSEFARSEWSAENITYGFAQAATPHWKSSALSSFSLGAPEIDAPDWARDASATYQSVLLSLFPSGKAWGAVNV
jgi:hypothetical protein